MSYQAITDIIVNQSQSQDFQLSAVINDSPSQPSVSFSEFLASIKDKENNTETIKAPDTEKISEGVKTEEMEKVSENQVEKESEKSSEKSSEIKAEKTESKASEKKPVAAKDESKHEIESKTDASDRVKKVGKDAKDLKKEKKLSEKDFSRLDEVTNKADLENENSKLAALPQDFSKTDEKLSVKNPVDSENESHLETEASIPLKINESKSDSKFENSDFDFSGRKENSKKQLTLDKEGKITVEDQRTKVEDKSADEAKKSAVKVSDIKLTNDSTAVMSVELNPNAEADVLSLNTQTAASNGSNFQAMLSNQLSNVAPEFVKAGNLVLKDNDQGTINLVLHPDDLGNVKIHLSLDGKTLSGQITVATKEALQVFKDNAETLREAFIKNGFDSASFDVSMNNGGSFNQNMGFSGQEDGTSLFAKRAYGESAGGLSAEIDDILDNVEDISNYSVNIVA